MPEQKTNIIITAQKTIDILITAISFFIAYYIRRYFLPGPGEPIYTDLTLDYLAILLLTVICWFISFNWMGMYMSYRQKPFWHFFVTILKSCFLGTVLLSIFMYAFHIQNISRLIIGIFLIVNIALLSLFKYFIFKTLEKIRTDDFNSKNILIVGSEKRAVDIIKAANQYRTTGYKILGCFESDASKVGQSVLGKYKVIGHTSGLETYLRNNVVDEMIITAPLNKIKHIDRHIAFAESMGIKVRIIPDWELHYLMYRPDIATIRFEKFLGIQGMALQSTPQNEGKLVIKQIFDFSASLLLLIICLPLFAVIGLLIIIFSRGPIFYSQERLGMNGRRFMVYKFRTMVKDADERLKELAEMNEADGPVFKIKNDPRIIPVIGSFLRSTSLDELPQLFNVLKGEMSLVGPRPPIPKEVDQYSIWHRRRLSMKPGLTCLWQIAPNRNQISFEDWMKMDLKYIDNWNLSNDFKIILMTIKAVLTGAGQ